MISSESHLRYSLKHRGAQDAKQFRDSIVLVLKNNGTNITTSLEALVVKLHKLGRHEIGVKILEFEAIMKASM